MILDVAQCILKSSRTGKYYGVYNSKWNKYAPVGGKLEGKEKSNPIVGLLREIEEEVGILDIKSIKLMGYSKEEVTRNGVTFYPNAALYVITFIGDVPASKEYFLKVVEFSNELVSTFLYGVNAYTCLKKIINKTHKINIRRN